MKHLMIIGAAILGAGLPLCVAAAPTIHQITVECPPTMVGEESACTVDGAPLTSALPVTFSGSGTRNSDSDVFTSPTQGFVATQLNPRLGLSGVQLSEIAGLGSVQNVCHHHAVHCT